VTLDVGDLLFQVGSHFYGIPLASHSGAPNGGNASLFPSVLADHFYQATTELTAKTVLGDPNVQYRPNQDVWLGGTVTDLGALSETITFHSGQTPSYVVEFQGQLPAAFLADVAANGGLTIDFSSATCGNGVLEGSGTSLSSVPEPASMMLTGGGLLVLGLLRSRIKKGSRS